MTAVDELGAALRDDLARGFNRWIDDLKRRLKKQPANFEYRLERLQQHSFSSEAVQSEAGARSRFGALFRTGSVAEVFGLIEFALNDIAKSEAVLHTECEQALSARKSGIELIRDEAGQYAAVRGGQRLTAPVLHRSAVALIDALGFKGIWQRHKPREVLDRLRALETESQAWKQKVDTLAVPVPDNLIASFRLAFLSDTVVMALSTKDARPGDVAEQAQRNSAAVFLVAGFVSSLLRAALSGTPELLYRGAIAFGPAALEDRFVVGGGVDEAAEAMNMPQGALVMLTESARRVFQPPAIAAHPLVAHDVPLKAGGHYASFCVTPFLMTDSDAELKRLEDAAARAFGSGNSIDVAVKRQETQRFLATARQQARRVRDMTPT